MSFDPEHCRMAEALLFAAVEPLDEATLMVRLPDGANIPAILAALEQQYKNKGINLIKVAGKWMFLTAPDLAFLLEEERQTTRKLSRAALETLAIVAYHQPVTRTEIEEIRGVGISRGTMDVLFEAGWIRPRGRRKTPGKPVTYGITEDFMIHFGLDDIKDLPGFDELKASGLLNSEPSGLFDVEENDLAELFIDKEEMEE
jgi:segregation and condensation protein B